MHTTQQLESDKSIELAGSGVTSVFAKRLDKKMSDRRRPDWLSGLIYYLRRKEKGMLATSIPVA